MYPMWFYYYTLKAWRRHCVDSEGNCLVWVLSRWSIQASLASTAGIISFNVLNPMVFTDRWYSPTRMHGLFKMGAVCASDSPYSATQLSTCSTCHVACWHAYRSGLAFDKGAIQPWTRPTLKRLNNLLFKARRTNNLRFNLILQPLSSPPLFFSNLRIML